MNASRQGTPTVAANAENSRVSTHEVDRTAASWVNEKGDGKQR